MATLTVAGCGGDPPTASRETPAATTAEVGDPAEATPSSEFAETTEELSQEDPDGADITYLVALDEPTDVAWAFRDIPESWDAVPAEGDVLQWAVTEGCFAVVEEPTGFQVDATDEAQVLKTQVANLETATGQTIQPGSLTSRAFPYISEPVTQEDTTAVTVLPYEGSDGLQGELYTYRNGKFAVLLSTGCLDGTFETVNAEQFQPFIADEVAVREQF